MMKLHLGLPVCSISCFFFVSSFLLQTFVSLSLPSLRPDQVDLLMALKNEFKPCNVMWTKNTITFDGVVFDNATGVVTELHLGSQCLSGSFKANSSLFRFKHLRHLDLSDNHLFGEVPSSIGNLSRLTSLDLSYNHLSGSFPFIYNITKLSFIDLSSNQFSGTIPSSLFSMSFLSSLKLSENRLKDPLETMNTSSSFKLKKLLLSKNLFSDGILEPISKLVSLTDLDLSFNDFVSTPFPFEIGKLANLELLNLESNGFIHEVPSSVCNLSHLNFLDLSSNNFTGPIPSCLLTTLSSLTYLRLSGNHLSDPLRYINSSYSSSKIQELTLGNNLFSGKILDPILKLVNLTYLDLSFLNITYPNNFSFLPLKSLKELDISGNSIPWLSSNPDYVLSTELTSLSFSSCNISEFPNFLKKQRNLQRLDISRNKIKGKVPEWLWNLPSLEQVSLSHNCFNSFEGSREALLNSSLLTLQLSSNVFQGSFPIVPPSLWFLSAANNNFTGDIPLSLCNSRLQIIILSNNNFSGSIPGCFGESLEVFNVRNNSLSGSLSDSFNRPYQSLTALDVGHNQITGKLPRSLVNCTSLEILNVENNRINDTFPFCLKDLRNLRVIVLRSNRFHGHISSLQDPLSFPQLRIIDISHNNFTGSLPTNYFVNWSAPMVSMPEVYRLPEYMQNSFWSYYDSIYVTNKGLSRELEKIPLIYTAIDFSGNRFEGQIPESIGLLKHLIVFNLSNNEFTGHIPSSLAKLTWLESLDLSRNQLSEKIPQELASLTFLEHIDVSYNKLTGQIPQSTQFGGQPKSSFEGNVDLCGLPLLKSCFEENLPHTAPTQQSESVEQEHVLNWNAAAIGYGSGVLVGLAIAQILVIYKPVLFSKLFCL